MRLLNQYIRISSATGFLLVMLLLLTVFSFLELVDQLEDVGKGYYRMVDAFLFVGLTMPDRFVTLTPPAALLGCLVGLGILDHGSELIAMRAAGVSARDIGVAVLKAGVLLMVAILALAEFVVPPLAQQAWRHRNTALAGTLNLSTEEGGFWFRDGLRFINVQGLAYGRIPTGIDIFEFDDGGELQVLTQAAQARAGEGGAWFLSDVTRKTFATDAITTDSLPTLQWDAFLTPQQTAAVQVEADSLALTDLYSYARDLHSRGENAERYWSVFWYKLSIPLATGAMVLISLPFLFGMPRITSTGQRVMIGAAVGIVFFLGGQLFNQFGAALNLPAAVTALLPAVLLMTVGLSLLERVR